MNIKDIELHDALVKSIINNFTEKKVLLALEYYPKDSKARRSISFIFHEVEMVSQTTCMESLDRNSFAGNVNYWMPEENGISHIYFTDGYMMIKGGKISVDEAT